MGSHGFALRSVVNPWRGHEQVWESGHDRLREQVLGVLEEAVRILKAATQSFSSGVGSFCGYPSQAR